MLADENGWFIGSVEAWPASQAWSLLSPDDDARMVWAPSPLFGATFSVSPAKQYPRGSAPLADRGRLEVLRLRGGAKVGEVEVQTLPLDRARTVWNDARAAAKRMGGAGFDVLVERGRRLWQIRPVDDVAALVLAGAIATTWQSPILPPSGERLFGVKGARLELERLGYAAG